MHDMKVLITLIEIHLEGVKSTTYLDIVLNGTRQLLNLNSKLHLIKLALC